MMESFFHTPKTECMCGKTFQTRKEARQSLFEYIEIFTIVKGGIRLWDTKHLLNTVIQTMLLNSVSTFWSKDQGVV